MDENPKLVVLDTNILISAILYGGKPRDILSQVLSKEILAITSPILLAELVDVLAKKFTLAPDDILLIEEEVKNHFILVYPKKSIEVLKKDPPDNRVLEAAVEGHCGWIVTGDKELLNLKSFRSIKIVTASEFILGGLK